MPHKLAALRVLLEELRAAYRLFKSKGDGGRAGATAALDAVNDFFLALPDAHAQKLNMPLLVLRGALDDLQVGKVAPILKPASKPDSHPYEPLVDQIIRGHAAYVADRLMAARVPKARNKVAAALLAGGYPAPGYPPKKLEQNIKSWREYYRREDAKCFARTVYLGKLAEHPEGQPPDEMLDRLTTLVEDTYPSHAALEPRN